MDFFKRKTDAAKIFLLQYCPVSSHLHYKFSTDIIKFCLQKPQLKKPVGLLGYIYDQKWSSR